MKIIFQVYFILLSRDLRGQPSFQLEQKFISAAQSLRLNEM